MWINPLEHRLEIERAVRLVRDSTGIPTGLSPRIPAYVQAIQALVAQSKPSIWVRIAPWHMQRVDLKYIYEFAKLGSLDGVLGCCKSLGINPDEVRAIHALIFG